MGVKGRQTNPNIRLEMQCVVKFPVVTSQGLGDRYNVAWMDKTVGGGLRLAVALTLCAPLKHSPGECARPLLYHDSARLLSPPLTPPLWKVFSLDFLSWPNQVVLHNHQGWERESG